MRYYLVENNRLTALPTAPTPLPDSAILLQSQKDLDVRRFPMSRLLTLFNGLPGVAPVRRFTDRNAGVKRLWAALADLPLGSSSRRDSKQAQIIALMQRPTGASMEELMAVTGWQSHSVRGVVSATLRKKLGLNVELQKDGNDRVYRISA